MRSTARGVQQGEVLLPSSKEIPYKSKLKFPIRPELAVPQIQMNFRDVAEEVIHSDWREQWQGAPASLTPARRHYYISSSISSCSFSSSSSIRINLYLNGSHTKV